MKILSQLAHWLYSHLSEKKDSGKENSLQSVKTRDDSNNLIEIRDGIIKAIVKALKIFTCNDVSRLTLDIYILNNTVYNGLGLEYDQDEFKASVQEHIKTELGIAFKTIIIYSKEPEKREKLKQAIGNGIDYLFFTVEETGTQAKISSMKGYGSIIGDIVHLQPNSEKVYNIGRGKNVQTKSGNFRTNDIAVDDDESNSEYQNNLHVSKSHAHISYKQTVGFVLYVDEGGTYYSGKRTRIQRSGRREPIDLGSDIKIPYPLQDGDIIELGKKVCLKFNFE